LHEPVSVHPFGVASVPSVSLLCGSDGVWLVILACAARSRRSAVTIARTASHNGYRFDIGGHRFFTKVPSVGSRRLTRSGGAVPPSDSNDGIGPWWS